ncbi:MAG: cytochrome c oxidase subunit 3, partial [Pseudomonadota bacterium]
LINTALLLTSSVTVTIAHHALLRNDRFWLKTGLFMTFSLGFLFLGLQVLEYYEAYHHLNLKLSSGIYGSTFFLLTGFHGLHVTLGSIMLFVIWLRTLRGHFSPDNHFGFEATAWYWHFVDVVWLGLFVFVYFL